MYKYNSFVRSTFVIKTMQAACIRYLDPACYRVRMIPCSRYQGAHDAFLFFWRFLVGGGPCFLALFACGLKRIPVGRSTARSPRRKTPVIAAGDARGVPSSTFLHVKNTSCSLRGGVSGILKKQANPSSLNLVSVFSAVGGTEPRREHYS